MSGYPSHTTALRALRDRFDESLVDGEAEALEAAIKALADGPMVTARFRLKNDTEVAVPITMRQAWEDAQAAAEAEAAEVDRLAAALKEAQAKVQHMHDLYKALGVQWGGDPFAVIQQLLERAKRPNDAPEEASPFQRELGTLLNRHSLENGSDTPDFLLAQFLVGALSEANVLVRQREAWYGRDPDAASAAAPSDAELDADLIQALTVAGVSMQEQRDAAVRAAARYQVIRDCVRVDDRGAYVVLLDDRHELEGIKKALDRDCDAAIAAGKAGA